ncbi:MAG: glucoamylase family protein [Bacteroidota bacterium]
MKTGVCVLLSCLAICLSGAHEKPRPWDPLLDTLQARTITWFLETTDPNTGMTPDRSPTPAPASMAAVGFALTTYPVAAERGIITRPQAAERVLNTLRHLYTLPQGNQPQGVAGYRGFFYHWLRLSDNAREWNCELSTIDTGLLMAGVLFCQSYFDRANRNEKEIRRLADTLYRRVDWSWLSEGREGLAFSWYPERGMSRESWWGYNESMIMYILAFGSPTHPAPPVGWNHWTSRYVWGTFYGQDFVNFGPLFGHQYSHCWIDFRGIQDAYMKEKGLDYFENSRRATITHRLYAIENPLSFTGYADTVWGLTACDGPRDTTFFVLERERKFHTYSARGVSCDWSLDDGTIAPTAAASSVPFAPEICIAAIRGMRNRYGTALWREHGFADAFNPTFITPHTPYGWFDHDYVGIDQGPIVLMIENYRTGLIWKVMKKNPYVIEGLRKAGFSGGWLDSARH